MSASESAFPDGARFAFSILDDTDDSTVDNTKPIYDLLYELGFRTTKTVWPVACPEGSRIYSAGRTLDDPGYLEFVRELFERGFEIAWHGATMESSDRARTLRGLSFVEKEFGRVLKIHCNHGQNRENIYWGEKRYQYRLLRSLARRFRPGDESAFGGELEDSPYFWGDLCRSHFRFVRNFAFAELDMLERNPDMPYRLEQTPYVNYWFSTSDAPNAEAFNHLVTAEGLERLEERGGVCIISTHLGKGFVADRKPHPKTAETLRQLARRPGWFVPVSEILEHMLSSRSDEFLSPLRLLRLELRHAVDRLRAGRRPWN